MGCFTLIAAIAIVVSAFTIGPLLTLGWVGIVVVLVSLVGE